MERLRSPVCAAGRLQGPAEAGGAAVGQGGGECHLLLRAGPAGCTLWLCQGPSREE